MQHNDDTSKSKKTEKTKTSTTSSLVTAWGGGGSQETWLAWKKETTIKAQELYSSGIAFREWYEWIAAQRHEIAKTLRQHPEHKLGIVRGKKSTLLYTRDEGDPRTYIMTNNRYSDFHPYLVSMFDSMANKKKQTPTAYFDLGPGTRKSAPGTRNAPDIDDNFSINAIHEVNSVYITHQAPFLEKPIIYSQLFAVDATTYAKTRIFYIIIDHTPTTQLENSFQVLEGLYQTLRFSKESSQEERIEIIKEMIWHLSQAMICERGSASITEIILNSLCEEYGIYHEEWKHYTPPDLIAIFSISPQVFSANFSLHPRKDMLEALDVLIEQNDINRDIAEKIKKVIEGQYEFHPDEKIHLETSSALWQLLLFFKNRGVLVEKILGSYVNALTLEQAVNTGKVEAVATFLANDETGIHTLDEEGNTLLHVAAKSGHFDVINVLLKTLLANEVDSDVGIDSRNKNGMTPLHLALIHGHSLVAKQLIAAKAKIDIADKEGNLPLHLAAQKSYGETIRALLAQRADINATNNTGETPLIIAIKQGSGKVVELLIKYKANYTSPFLIKNPNMLDQFCATLDEKSKERMAAFVKEKNSGVKAVLNTWWHPTEWAEIKMKPIDIAAIYGYQHIVDELNTVKAAQAKRRY